MNFRQAAILFSLGLGLAEGKKSKGTKKSPKSCITAADAMATINAFAGAVPAVQRARNSPGGCQAAYTAATGALDVAYGYNLGLVLFKPVSENSPAAGCVGSFVLSLRTIPHTHCPCLILSVPTDPYFRALHLPQRLQRRPVVLCGNELPR